MFNYNVRCMYYEKAVQKIQHFRHLKKVTEYEQVSHLNDRLSLDNFFRQNFYTKQLISLIKSKFANCNR